MVSFIVDLHILRPRSPVLMKMKDVFDVVHSPVWSWPGTSVLPGGTLMAQATAAAYQTVESDFAIDSLTTHFLSGPDPKIPLRIRIQRPSDGGRFVTRVAVVEQNGRNMVHVFCSFVRASALGGSSMTHRVSRQSTQTVDAITLDDLELAKSDLGPYMKFQRLPLVSNTVASNSKENAPESMIYTSVATISPKISSSDSQIHAIGIIGLSDYHVLDAPPTLHGLTFGLPRINDTTRTRTEHNFKMYTTLNHTIHFHLHNDFRADDLCYIEVNSPWAGERRAEILSRIFDRSGRLIATCKQEAYYVLKEDAKDSRL